MPCAAFSRGLATLSTCDFRDRRSVIGVVVVQFVEVRKGCNTREAVVC